MKSLMILGSIAGFFIGAGCSLSGGCPWSVVVWRALAAALAAGLLARWWGGVWRQGWQGAFEQRRNEPPAPRPNPKPSGKL